MSCGDAPEPQDGEEKAETTMPKRRNVRRVDKGTCLRCRTARSKFIIRSATYCTECFETNVFSRFTRILYPPLRPMDPVSKRPTVKNLYRPPQQAGNVLVALSGGAGSTVMLDMLHRGEFIGKGDGRIADKTKGEKEAVWDSGTVVYVEFAGVVSGMEDRMEDVRATVEARGLDFVGLRAEDVYDRDLSSRLGGQASSGDGVAVDLRSPYLSVSLSSSSSTPLESLRSLLASLPPPSRPAVLSNILHSLLITTATSLPHISHLLVGETSTRQAQRVVSGTAMGRGWALPLELASSMALPEGMTRISPMKDLSLKEAAFACKIRGLGTVNQRNWGTVGDAAGEKRDARGKGGAMSIEGLTEQFIAGLDVSHPATVSTINKTGNKLVFPGKEDGRLCPVCQLPVDSSALEWKSRTALTSLGKTPVASPDQPASSQTRSGLAGQLCYACLTTLTPATHTKIPAARDHVNLPLWVRQRVAVGREEMRAEVAEFLLEED